MTTLLGGHQSVEIETTTELWDVSRDRLRLEEFLRRRGYQGSMQGELSARVWREDPSPVERLIATFGSMSDDNDPRIVERRCVDARLSASATSSPRCRWPSGHGLASSCGSPTPTCRCGRRERRRS